MGEPQELQPSRFYPHPLPGNPTGSLRAYGNLTEGLGNVSFSRSLQREGPTEGGERSKGVL